MHLGRVCPEERQHHLTDANYNMVMRTDAPPDGRGVERMYYSAYGQPECFPFGDVTGDYVVDANDHALLIQMKDGNQPYNVLGDLNLDGQITQADLNLYPAYIGNTGGSNVLSVDLNWWLSLIIKTAPRCGGAVDMLWIML